MDHPLSPRELVREGKTNVQIATALDLSRGTIKEYVSDIFRKIGVTNRTALAIWAHCEARPMRQPEAREQVA
jgi:DNA-binding NarL/FixJ family response regulator